MKYKIGDYIKIKIHFQNQKWYHSQPMKIIGFSETNYVLDKDYFEEDPNLIAQPNSFQDHECIKISRIEKIEQLIK